MYFVCMHLPVPCVCNAYGVKKKKKKDVRATRNRVTDHCESAYGVWKLNQAALKEQPVFSTTKTSFEPKLQVFVFFKIMNRKTSK